MAVAVGAVVRGRRNALAFAFGFALVCYCAILSAAETCYNYRVDGNYGSGPANYFYSTVPAEACTAAAMAYVAEADAATSSIYEFLAGNVTSGGTQCQIYFRWKCASCSLWSYTSNLYRAITNMGATACPPPPTDDCDELEGKKVTYAQQFGSLPSMGTNYNIPVAGGCGADMTAAASCSANSSGYFCLVTYTYTGDPPEPSPTAPTGTAAECAYIAGKQNCAITTDEETDQTCGTINGERICFAADPTTSASGQPPAGTCWSTPGDGLLCASDASVEDEGGDPVAPTSTLITNNSTTNYYSSSTLGAGGGTAIITGTGTMGNESTADPNCEGVDCLTGGDMEAAAGSDQIAGGAYSRIEGAPIVAAVSGLGGSLSGGACPSWSTPINAGPFGSFVVDFSFICSMWDDIASVIAAVMLAGWVFLALRILMSA